MKKKKRPSDETRFNHDFDMLVDAGYVEPTDVTAEGDALYRFNNEQIAKLFESSEFMQVCELPDGLGLRIDASRLFSNGNLHPHPVARGVFEEVTPVVRFGATLTNGCEPTPTAIRCWHEVLGKRCGNRIHVSRQEDAILWLCSGCEFVGAVLNWRGTPWDPAPRQPTQDHRSRL